MTTINVDIKTNVTEFPDKGLIIILEKNWEYGYNCPNCSEKLWSHYGLITHIRLNHPKLVPYRRGVVCNYCGDVFLFGRDAEAHAESECSRR